MENSVQWLCCHLQWIFLKSKGKPHFVLVTWWHWINIEGMSIKHIYLKNCHVIWLCNWLNRKSICCLGRTCRSRHTDSTLFPQALLCGLLVTCPEDPLRYLEEMIIGIMENGLETLLWWVVFWLVVGRYFILKRKHSLHIIQKGLTNECFQS